ncbi:MAG: dephospho-CoA kinase [Cellvibrio sp.]
MSSYVIGLTGGIGSGKSEVSRRFESFGIQVVDADVISREVVQLGSKGLEAIKNRFGKSVLNADGTLNRAELREIIFSDKDQKNWLEQLLHPLVNQEIRAQLATPTSAYKILVSPLLLETQQHLLVNRILVVDVPESVQIERASQRDGVSVEQIRRIIASQISRDDRLKRADDVIDNTSDLTALDNICRQLHAAYLSFAKQQTF